MCLTSFNFRKLGVNAIALLAITSNPVSAATSDKDLGLGVAIADAAPTSADQSTTDSATQEGVETTSSNDWETSGQEPLELAKKKSKQVSSNKQRVRRLSARDVKRLAELGLQNQQMYKFKQTTPNELRKKGEVVTNGEAIFARNPSVPGSERFRWNVNETNESWMYYKDEKGVAHVINYNRVTNTSQVYSVKNERASEIQEIFNMAMNFEEVLKRYKIASATQDGNVATIKLEPKKKGKSDVVSATIVFNLDENVVVMVHLQYERNYTKVEFKSVFAKENFRAPEGSVPYSGGKPASTR